MVGRKLQIDSRDIQVVREMPMTTPARTWCDLAVRLGLQDLVAAGDHIVHEPYPLATRLEFEDAVARHRGRRGRARLSEALTLLDGDSWSPAESIVRVTLARAGITGFVSNYPIADARGTVWAYGDLTFPEHRVIIEYQSDYHRGLDQYRADRTRIARLIAAGWHVLEITADQLHDPAELVQLVRQVLILYPPVARH